MSKIAAIDQRIAELDDEIAARQAERSALVAQRNAQTPFGRLPRELLDLILDKFYRSCDLYSRANLGLDGRVLFARDLQAMACVYKPLFQACAPLLQKKYIDHRWKKMLPSTRDVLSELPLLQDIGVFLSRLETIDTDCTPISEATSLFVIYNVEDVTELELLAEDLLVPLPTNGLTAIRILFDDDAEEVDGLHYVLEMDTWKEISRLTLQNGKFGDTEFPVYTNQLQHVELIDVTLRLSAVHDLLHGSPKLVSIRFINVKTTDQDDLGTHMTLPVELEALDALYLSGQSNDIADILPLLPSPRRQLCVDCTDGVGTDHTLHSTPHNYIAGQTDEIVAMYAREINRLPVRCCVS